MKDDIRIEEILKGRGERAKIQNEMIQNNHSTLISFTLNTPGLEKNNNEIKKIFKTGIREINEGLKNNNIKIINERIDFDKISGPEAFFALDEDAEKVKELAVDIEDTFHGRLYDIDVLTKEKSPISRKDLGYKPRYCIICGEEAKICTRSEKHRKEEVINKFYSIYKKYF